jgi:hypothetical protein
VGRGAFGRCLATVCAASNDGEPATDRKVKAVTCSVRAILKIPPYSSMACRVRTCMTQIMEVRVCFPGYSGQHI